MPRLQSCEENVFASRHEDGVWRLLSDLGSRHIATVSDVVLAGVAEGKLTVACSSVGRASAC